MLLPTTNEKMTYIIQGDRNFALITDTELALDFQSHSVLQTMSLKKNAGFSLGGKRLTPSPILHKNIAKPLKHRWLCNPTSKLIVTYFLEVSHSFGILSREKRTHLHKATH